MSIFNGNVPRVKYSFVGTILNNFTKMFTPLTSSL